MIATDGLITYDNFMMPALTEKVYFMMFRGEFNTMTKKWKTNVYVNVTTRVQLCMKVVNLIQVSNNIPSNYFYFVYVRHLKHI